MYDPYICSIPFFNYMKIRILKSKYMIPNKDAHF